MNIERRVDDERSVDSESLVDTKDSLSEEVSFELFSCMLRFRTLPMRWPISVLLLITTTATTATTTSTMPTLILV